MGLENVIDEIISQAEKQKQEIIDQGKQEAKKIVDEAMRKGNEQAKKFDEETRRIIGETKKMELSAGNIKTHKMMLEAKKSILDEVYNQVIEKVSKIDSSKRKEILHKLVERAEKELEDAKFVYCAGRDKELVSDMKGLKFGGEIDCIGGVIVENSSKTIKINYTFDVLLKDVKEIYLNEISKKIFQS